MMDVGSLDPEKECRVLDREINTLEKNFKGVVWVEIIEITTTSCLFNASLADTILSVNLKWDQDHTPVFYYFVILHEDYHLSSKGQIYIFPKGVGAS